MPDNTRFILGYGERLTGPVDAPRGGQGPEPAYSFSQAVARLRPMLQNTVDTLTGLPESAKPEGEAVGVITLHPQWMAKSYHPQLLLDEYDLRQVGSRPAVVTPERWTRRNDPEEMPSTDLYVAGTTDAFARWSQEISTVTPRIQMQVQRLESVRAPRPSERLRSLPDTAMSEPLILEVVLHASEDPRDDFILSGFEEHSRILGAEPDFDRRLYAGGLCFLPVLADVAVVNELALFSFLRVARLMPRLRGFPAIERSSPTPGLDPAPLPVEDAVDPDLRIAVFDGGLQEGTSLARWSVPHDGPGVGAGHDALFTHGHDVTSAMLFGPLLPGVPASRPFGVVDHYRVLDRDAERDPYELYDVLRRIDEVLKRQRYEFVNFSIGPSLPVEDDEVHSWTALLDQYLAEGNTLASFAVGNSGLDGPGESRIQVPADCVNGLSVGAADSTRSDWKRAPYSSIGPGRSPGIVKPDVVHFGGHGQETFLVYDSEAAPGLSETCGTSFAAPAALRVATGIRAHFGTRLSPLALKALLVHTAHDGNHPAHEVGWGRVATNIANIATCADGMVRVIYQGELTPSKYLRAFIPLPDSALRGYVEVDATFCFATPTDPQDPGSYTRSGLEVFFRPDARAFPREESDTPISKPFFQRSDFDSEQIRRTDAQKWETTLNKRKRFRGQSLYRPMFDIHYNARSGGGSAVGAKKMRYALVVTVRSSRTPDLYDRVVRQYAGLLEAMVPLVEIPVRV